MNNDRRDFMKRALVAGAGLAALTSGGIPRLGWSEEEKHTSAHQQSQSDLRMVIAQGQDPKTNVEMAVEQLGGMGRFVSRGDRVIVKPNIGWDRRVDQGANTHPDVVAAVVGLCLAAGAKWVKVLDNTCNDPRRCYRQSGIEEAAKEAGAKVEFLDKRRLVETDLEGEAIGKWPVYKDFVEVDAIINVPVAKHHSLARVTLGMKNWFGAIGGRRDQLHQNVHVSCVDIAAFFQPKLTVLDATRVLLRNGPQGGNPKDAEWRGIVAASVDPVAAEAFGATLFGIEPSELPVVELAEKRGLGTRDLDAPSILRLDTENSAELKQEHSG